VLAAAALAYFEAGYLGPLKKKRQYKPRRRGEVSRCPARLCCLPDAFSFAPGRWQELTNAKEAAKLDREQRKERKAEKLEAARVKEAQRQAERQATTGIKKLKRGPTTAGEPLAVLAWEPVAVVPSPMPAFAPIPVEIAPMPAYDPSALATADV
jgi:hypothetical protein